MVDKSGKTPTRELIRLRFGREVEDIIRELYLQKRYSDREIAEAIGVDRVTVNAWRKEFGITRTDRRPPALDAA